jgi:uncharacterized protein (TIGR02598 family)
MRPPAAPSPRRSSGFTLAEVMIALSIVATVMVGMLAAMPQALRSIRESNNLTIMGRIAQEIIGDIQMSEWDDIDKNFKSQKFSYDNEGLPFEGRVGQYQTYEARVELLQQPASLGDNLQYRTDHMLKVKVQVEYLTNGIYNKNDEIRKRNTQEYHFVVANQNKLKVQ